MLLCTFRAALFDNNLLASREASCEKVTRRGDDGERRHLQVFDARANAKVNIAGSCEDSIDSFRCKCPPCYGGSQCESRQDDCLLSLGLLHVNSTWHATTDDARVGAHAFATSIALAISLPICITILLVVCTFVVVVFKLWQRVGGLCTPDAARPPYSLPNAADAQVRAVACDGAL